MPTEIRVLIVDDHKVVRDGLKFFLAPMGGIEVIGEAENGLEAIEKTGRLHPDVVLMDLLMPVMNGVEATRAIKEKHPDVQVLVISSFAEDEKVVAAIRAGASGYLLKDSSPQDLQTSIFEIFNGESALPPRIANIVIRALNQPETPPNPHAVPLTDREIEVLKMVARGYSNQEIADQLVISVWTVRTHLTNILTKLNLENRTQAALFALREGLAQLNEE